MFTLFARRIRSISRGELRDVDMGMETGLVGANSVQARIDGLLNTLGTTQ